ncbi:hypothetical protein F2P56_005141 [Juglans regia]|uniref:Protein IQ-DOMAIN 1-like n=2 Tax=Juglans regia TaxID=51240 RepID=A0A2I4H126_JUGRE|nr:protein IQ-DOMAIN 1-like [Juglans regia]XP_018849866.1 protein IQ-DOMAIN 1-like [Juglans regia]KAF5478598.1 hypothetical protein F2P56_005141 [Juglans regia]
MGSGDWFRSLISIKRVKEDRSKQAKVHSTTDKPNGSKSKDHSHNESSSSSNDRPIENLPDVPPVPVKEDIAATRIQTAFRAYMVRKKVCHLKKGTVRYQSLIQDQTVTQQASTALSHIHLWSRIQDQIRARRLRMVTEGRLRQKKSENQLKFEAKLHELEVEWCGGSETMEEILSRIRQREEAAIKRERAMAYAFSHQWRANSSQYLGQASYSLGKENWGWSWMERWIAARPWEIRVHSNSADSNKAQAKQSTLNKVANQPEKKISVSVKPAFSNEKGTTKAKDLVQPTTEK